MRPSIAEPDRGFLLELNTRQLLRDVGRGEGRASLADVSDALIDEWRRSGYDAVWLMGVWTTGGIGRELSAAHPSFAQHHDRDLPDWTEADVCGSPYAVQSYTVHPDFGGDSALDDLRSRINRAGLKLILDFVPNHTARDHAWSVERPELYVSGSEDDAEAHPDRFVRQNGGIVAYGRDPYFPGWIDTLQLDYRRAATRQSMIETLHAVAARCDGVRCDMAMLVLRDIFLQTWGGTWEGGSEEFWAAAIDDIRARHPGFLFIAEAYWGLEDWLQLLGFDFTYDKALYDHIVARDVVGLRQRLESSTPDHDHSLHFLENHDEPRAAAAIPDAAYRRAAMALMACLPGRCLIHDGQVAARRYRHSIHLARRQPEEPDKDEIAFYAKLLGAIEGSAVRRGAWQLLQSRPTWAGDDSHHDVFGMFWDGQEGQRSLIVINITGGHSEAHLPLRFFGIAGREWQLSDRLSSERYRRNGDDMAGTGLFVRLKPYQAQLFDIVPTTNSAPPVRQAP